MSKLHVAILKEEVNDVEAFSIKSDEALLKFMEDDNDNVFDLVAAKNNQELAEAVIGKINDKTNDKIQKAIANAFVQAFVHNHAKVCEVFAKFINDNCKENFINDTNILRFNIKRLLNNADQSYKDLTLKKIMDEFNNIVASQNAKKPSVDRSSTSTVFFTSSRIADRATLPQSSHRALSPRPVPVEG